MIVLSVFLLLEERRHVTDLSAKEMILSARCKEEIGLVARALVA